MNKGLDNNSISAKCGYFSKAGLAAIFQEARQTRLDVKMVPQLLIQVLVA